MKVLLIDSCHYMRDGMIDYLQATPQITLTCAQNITEAAQAPKSYDVLLINLTQCCQQPDNQPELYQFLQQSELLKIYAYLDRPYIADHVQIDVMPNRTICAKSQLISCLEKVRFSAKYPELETLSQQRALFSQQEIVIMHGWMSQMPIQLIAKRLNISHRTVYVHKRNIMQKIPLRNQAKFYSLYQVMKYLLPATQHFPELWHQPALPEPV